MMTLRAAEERGKADFGWLQSRHSFSFGRYIDRRFMGFGPLRVINEDWVQGGQGFDTHPHDNMEIVTYVMSGALEHKDSMGNGSIIRPGEVQHMSAGTGVYHSEFNPSESESVHLLQIWFLPDEIDIKPVYSQKAFSAEERKNKLRLLLSQGGRNDSLKINQDVDYYGSLLDEGHKLTLTPQPNRLQWVQLAKGGLNVNGTDMREGDGLAISDESEINILANMDSEFLFFDMTK